VALPTQVDPLKVPGGVGGTEWLLGGEAAVGWEFQMANIKGRTDDELGRGGKGRPGRPPKSNEMKLKKNEKVWCSDGGRGAVGAAGAGGAGGARRVGRSGDVSVRGCGWLNGPDAKKSAFVSPAAIAPKKGDGGEGEDAVGARACGNNKAEKYSSKQQDTCHRLAGTGSSTPTVLVT
jgi:hypothetical protein